VLAPTVKICAASSIGRMKILVVDPSVESRASVADALLELTNLVILDAVGDVKGAIEVLTANPPDVVVTDCDLPDGNCLDVIAAARSVKAPPAVVVYPVTHIAERGGWCLEAGADLYLPRSGGMAALKAGVRELASKRETANVPTEDRFELIGKLAAGVVHDVNNYLQAADMMLHLGQKEPAREAIARAVAVTSTVLQYVRGGAPPMGPIDLGTLARRVVRLFGRIMSSRVEVVIEIDEDVPPIWGIEPEIEQLVINLVLNACEAMPDGGQLWVAVRQQDGGVMLEVADTGTGIGEVPSAGMLTPSTKRAKGGDGLGLGIVRGVVDRHDAHLRLVRCANGGTRATVMFTAATAS
jgi:signal transduction histidine kinase